LTDRRHSHYPARSLSACGVLFFGLLGAASPARGYSVLAHEALIDRNWDSEIKPLIVARFPGTTPEQLQKAHAYAYGGSIIQDIGYYPFGSKFFSDLAHYVRSGDFVATMIRDAADANEYAFALGALAHYAADNTGHPIAVNRAVPLTYPKLERKFGPEVTYEDNPAAHLKTEFAFDVIQVARGAYTPDAYRDFVGFEVGESLLERAFVETYSLELKNVFHNIDLALGTYRYTVSHIVPEMTKTAWSAKNSEIQKLQAGMTKNKFVYRLSRAEYRKQWKEPYSTPGPGARLLGFVFRIIPKIGPFKALGFKVPNPEAERLFLTSLEVSVDRYRALLGEVRQQQPRLTNENIDIGRPTRLGDYWKADDAYSKLLEQLSGITGITSDLRANILAFYSGSPGPRSEKARAQLTILRAGTPAS
jgi:Zinc dependent phospholipase C